MNALGTWLASTPLGSAFKTFVAVLIAAAVADFASGGINLSGWEPWVIAGMVSALPPVINWLNPDDGRYGREATSD